MEVLCTTRFKTPLGSLRIVSSEKGLVYIELPNESGRGFEGWKKTHAREAKVVERRAAQDDAIDQLLEFTSGERREFTIDLDMRATDFQCAVYRMVGRIKYGGTVSYSDIADSIDKPKAVRAVGAANGANPIPLVIPCHRVIARGGALQGYAGGLQLKAKLLAMESAYSECSPSQKRLF
ncbi:MAG: methylated-DNA--[protein]-cysteine S-methyltransferase [Myxococcota bacterium]